MKEMLDSFFEYTFINDCLNVEIFQNQNFCFNLSLEIVGEIMPMFFPKNGLLFNLLSLYVSIFMGNLVMGKNVYKQYSYGLLKCFSH